MPNTNTVSFSNSTDATDSASLSKSSFSNTHDCRSQRDKKIQTAARSYDLLLRNLRKYPTRRFGRSGCYARISLISLERELQGCTPVGESGRNRIVMCVRKGLHPLHRRLRLGQRGQSVRRNYILAWLQGPPSLQQGRGERKEKTKNRITLKASLI